VLLEQSLLLISSLFDILDQDIPRIWIVQCSFHSK